MTGEAPEVRSDEKHTSLNLIWASASISTNQHPSTSISINQHQSTWVRINKRTNQYQSASICITQHQPASINTNQYQSASTNINQCQSVSVSINQHWPGSISIMWDQLHRYCLRNLEWLFWYQLKKKTSQGWQNFPMGNCAKKDFFEVSLYSQSVWIVD